MLALAMVSTLLGSVSASTQSQMHLITQHLVLSSLPQPLPDDARLDDDALPPLPRDPYAGQVRGFEVLLGALSILGVDSIALTALIFAIAGAFQSNTAALLPTVVFLILEAVGVPVVAALVVNAASGRGPKGGGLGGAMLGAFLAQIVTGSLVVLAAFAVPFLWVPAIVAHFILIPVVASLGMHWGKAQPVLSQPIVPSEQPSYVPSLHLHAMETGSQQIEPLFTLAF